MRNRFVVADGEPATALFRLMRVVVVRHPLGREQIRAITEIQIGYLQARLSEHDIGLRLTTAALVRLGDQPVQIGVGAGQSQPARAALAAGRFMRPRFGTQQRGHQRNHDLGLSAAGPADLASARAAVQRR